VVANYRYFLAEADVPPNVDENQAPPE